MFLYGIHPVAAVLRKRPHEVRRVILARQRNDAALQTIRDECRLHDIRIEEEDQRSLDSRIGSGQHQGVVAEVAPFPLRDIAAVLEACNRGKQRIFFLVLDGVQDPQNMGALIRTAVCCGVQAVVFPQDRAAQLTPAVAKASAGAIEEIHLCRVVNIAATLKYLKHQGIWVVGTSPRAPQNIYGFDFDRDLAIVVGSEGRGLRALVAKSCDMLVSIPLHGPCESLNVSAAGAVVLFEVVRQRHYRRAT